MPDLLILIIYLSIWCHYQSLALSSRNTDPGGGWRTLLDATDISEKVIDRVLRLKASDFWIEKFHEGTVLYWEKFYRQYGEKFFHDRHYIEKEFSCVQELLSSVHNLCVVEFGCGVGNAIVPFVENNLDRIGKSLALDCSNTAISHLQDRIQKNGLSDILCTRVVDICEISSAENALQDFCGRADIVILLFVLSAVNPSDHEGVKNLILKTLKPGGVLIFRDYAKNDQAQLQLAAKTGSTLGPDFYVRGDGTKVKFFSLEEVASLFESSFNDRCDEGINTPCPRPRVERIELVTRERTMVNRKENKQMSRRFIQGQWRLTKE